MGCGLTSVYSWCNFKINEDKSQTICFCYGYCQAEYYIALSGKSSPFINHVKYLGVILDRRVICGHHIETIKAYYSYANGLALALKLAPQKYSLGLQGLTPASPENLLQTPSLRNYTTSAKQASRRDLHWNLNIYCLYHSIIKLCRQQAGVLRNHENENVANGEQGETEHGKYEASTWRRSC